MYIRDEAYCERNTRLKRHNALVFRGNKRCKNFDALKFFDLVRYLETREVKYINANAHCAKCDCCAICCAMKEEQNKEIEMEDNNMGVKRFATNRQEVSAIQFNGSNYDEIMDFTKREVSSEWVCGLGDCCHIRINGSIFNIPSGHWLVCNASISGEGKDMRTKIVWSRYSPEEFSEIYEEC